MGELYCDRETDEILNRLKYASQNQLFAVLIGEPGMGKTTMLRHLKEEMEGTEYAVLYLSDSQMTPRSFYNSLLEQLGCDTKFQRSAARRSLHQELEVMRGVSHQKVIVIVDEGAPTSKGNTGGNSIPVVLQDGFRKPVGTDYFWAD